MWRVEDHKVEIFWGDPSWLHKRRASSIWREARAKVMMRNMRGWRNHLYRTELTPFFIEVVLIWPNQYMLVLSTEIWAWVELDTRHILAKANRKGHGSGTFPPPAKWSNTVVDHQSRSEVVLTSGLVIPHPPSPLLGPQALKTHLLCTQESKIVRFYGVSQTFFL